MTNLRLIIILGGIMFFFCGGSCKKGWIGENFYTLFIDNQSGKVVTPYKALYPGYMDTILPPGKPPSVTVQPGASYTFTSQVPYEKIFQQLPRDTMSIFFFDYETFSSLAWEEIRNNRKFLIRYELSLEDLKKLNWRVPYPPTEAMKNMKQVLP
jgi:hypothetical protein